MTRRRRDPYSWEVASLPERELAELILELAPPLLEKLDAAFEATAKQLAKPGSTRGKKGAREVMSGIVDRIRARPR